MPLRCPRWCRWLFTSPIASPGPHPLAEDQNLGRTSYDSTEESEPFLRADHSSSVNTRSNVEGDHNQIVLFDPSGLNIIPRLWTFVKKHALRCIRRAASRSAPNSQTLYGKLRQARITCTKPIKQRYFIPKSDLDHLITVEAVRTMLRCLVPRPDVNQLGILAQRICTIAPRLFATLVSLERQDQIVPLLQDGVSDADLPFQFRDANPRQAGSYSLQGKDGKDIRTLNDWNDQESEAFHCHQWWMIAPTFVEGQHLHFDDNEVLPFTYRGPPINGGFSTVYFCKIHPHHHNFSSIKQFSPEGCHVAIKKLNTANPEDDFKKETAFFATLKEKRTQPHPHLMFLVATFDWSGKYFLVFPWAEHNLQTYWETKRQFLDEGTMRWWLEQLAGIVNGLYEIHGSRVSANTSASQGSEESGSSIQLKDGEEKFGRHGDIKPENILWLPPSDPLDDPRGTLVLADFGLGRFHRKNTRSNIPYQDIKSSPTYEPPELKLHRPVSRAYDMWSLACIFLEFATWILKGQDGIEEFAKRRDQPDRVYANFSNDEFFDVVGDNPHEAEVRKGVSKWVKLLRQDERCSDFLHDILSLTMNHLLVIDQADRLRADELNQEFERFQVKARDPDYLVKPASGTTSPTTQGTRPFRRRVSPRINRGFNVSSSRTTGAGTGRSSAKQFGPSYRSNTWPIQMR